MGKRILCGLLSLLIAGGLAGCASFADAGKRSVTYMDVFDTVCTVTVYGARDFDSEAQRFHAELRRYHQLFDIYNTYEGINNLKTINDAAGGDPVAVEQPVLDLLSYGQQVYDLTQGRVNVLFGAVLTLWHDARTRAQEPEATASLPDPAALQKAAAHTDMSALELDVAAGTVRLADPYARLDVGAVAKGFAAQRMAEFAREELGWTSALLDIGGNICAVGDKTGTPFSIGIRNPDTDSAKTYLLTVGVQDGAVVTSGDYQRYFTVDGKRYHHIIDTHTLYPADCVRAVTVLCADSALADALSTALFTMSVADGKAFLEQIQGAEAVWVQQDGSLAYSDGFEAYLLS